MRVWLTVLVLGIAVGTAAFTITQTVVTASFRKWIASKSAWLGKLFGCPYCLSHWLAAIAVLIYRPRILDLNVVLDLGVVWFVTIFVSTITWGLIRRQMNTLMVSGH